MSGARAIATALTLAALLAGAGVGAGCGGGSGEDGGDRTARSERDPAGDVLDARAAEAAVGAGEEPDERTIDAALTDARPDLDLRAARLAVTGRTLHLRVETEAPIRAGTFVLTAALDEACSDVQLTAEIRVERDGATTVRATDVPDGKVRAVAATAAVDGEQLTLALPLRAPATFESWWVSDYDTSPAETDRARYGDTIPDWFIEGAYFTRGTGKPNDAGDGDPCGPPDPPLLAR